MIDIKKERKLKAESLLAMGETPKQIADKLQIPYVTVMSWKKKLAEQSTDLDTVVDVDITTLHQVANKIKETAPEGVSKQVDKLVEGVTGLKQLEPKFHSVVMNLLEKAETLSKDNNLTVKDWLALSNGIGNLYANIFNKSGVNVNVLNQTQVSNEKLTMFRGTMRHS